MTRVDNYIVNYETLLLIPNGESETKVFEMDQEFLVKKRIGDIIKDSCLFFGSSYEGRRDGTKSLLNCSIKVPIILEDSRNLIIFPTHSFKNQNNIWVVYNNIVNYKKYDFENTVFMFRNNNDIKVNVRYNIIDNQIVRCLKMEAILKKRKELK